MRFVCSTLMIVAALFFSVMTSAQNYTIVDLGTIGGTTSSSVALNNVGEVAGWSLPSGDTPRHAFLYSHGVMTDLGTLGGDQSFATGIDVVGQVTGDYITGTGRLSPHHAFLYSGGVTSSLGALGGTASSAFAINDSGQVVGQASTSADVETHAFLYSTGVMNDLGTLGGTFSSAQAINNSGQVAGVSTLAGDTTADAFLFSNGVMFDLGTLGGTQSFATAINATGQVTGVASLTNDAGQHPFLYTNGTMTDLGTFCGTCPGQTGYAYAINNSGQVVGYSFSIANGTPHAFLYTAGVMTDLGTFGGVESEAFAINNGGQVTGQAYTTTDALPHAFVYRNGMMFDLNTLIPSGSGSTLVAGMAINDSGQIMALGRIANDVQHAFLLTPQVLDNTQVGSNISVSPVDSATGEAPVSLTFSNVVQSGSTSVSISSSGFPPPSTFQLGNPPAYFDLHTSATYSGLLTVCINYRGISFTDTSELRLFHFEGAGWVDVTVSVDTSTQTVCGNVGSLSPFAIFQSRYKAAVQPPVTSDGSSVFNASRGVVPVKFTLALSGAPTCQLPPASISLFRTTGTTAGTVNESTYALASDNGSTFRSDGCQYVYNLASGSLGTGTYRVQIILGGVVIGNAVFGLR